MQLPIFLKSMFGLILEGVIAITLILFFLEGCSRLVHFGVRPMLPYIADDALSPRMPPGFDSKIQFSGSKPFRLCTDDYGLRLPHCGQQKGAARVLTVGDSQAMGWAMDFSDTFTVQVARELGETKESAGRAMASGGADVESLLGWAKDYRSKISGSQPSKLNIVVVNLGNDLDEMYFGRYTGRVSFMKPLRDWLTVNSYLMLDFNLLQTKFFKSKGIDLPAGANPVVFMLSKKEREQLAIATADAALRLLRTLPPAERSTILLLPTDYQVAGSEFVKYRKFYSDVAQYDRWASRVGTASAALNDIEQQIAKILVAQKITVVAPRMELSTFDPVAVFDRSSHHFTVYGHKVLAQAILQSLKQTRVQAGVVFNKDLLDKGASR